MRRIVLAIIMAAFACPAILGDDEVYVEQPGAKGVNLRTEGQIVEFKPTYVVLETSNHERVVYTREVVWRIILDSNLPRDKDKNKDAQIRNHWERLNSGYWNPDKSRLVEILKSTPWAGGYFSFLDRFRVDTGAYLAALILFAMLGYASYRLYEFMVVATGQQTLNREKLTLEVSKLRYEIESIRIQPTATTDLALEEARPRGITQVPVLPIYKFPQVRRLDFLKHKILGVPTPEERQRQADLWRKKWQAYNKKGPRQGAVAYYFRTTLNLFGTILMFTFGLGWFADIFLPFTKSGFADFGPAFSFLFLALFIFSIAVAVRLIMRRRIMRETYNEVNG